MCPQYFVQLILNTNNTTHKIAATLVQNVLLCMRNFWILSTVVLFIHSQIPGDVNRKFSAVGCMYKYEFVTKEQSILVNEK